MQLTNEQAIEGQLGLLTAAYLRPIDETDEFEKRMLDPKFEPVRQGLITVALEVLMPKRHDYSGNDDPLANFRLGQIIGIAPPIGAMLRLLDKISRLSVLYDKEGMVKDESLVDTLADAINYVCIVALLISEIRPELFDHLDNKAAFLHEIGGINELLLHSSKK